MRTFKTANYKKMAEDRKERGCTECGNLAVGYKGLCQKCQEEEERSRERNRDSGENRRINKKALDMDRYESQGMMGEPGGETDEFKEDNQFKVDEGPQYVSVYEVSRAYGGAEEGGWWYDVYSLVDTKQVSTRIAALAVKDFLINKYKDQNKETGPLDSSKGFESLPEGTEDYQIPKGFSGSASEIVVLLENEPGSMTTTERPHYE